MIDDGRKGIDIPYGVSPVRPVYRVCGCCGTSGRRGDGSFNVGLIVSHFFPTGDVGDIPLLIYMVEGYSD